MSNKTFVLYHGSGCPDGFCSAWLASGVLGRGDDIVYVPMNYGDPLPTDIDLNGEGRRIFLLDFSLSRNGMQFIAEVADEVICLDHHKSAAQELAGLDGTMPGLKIVFDMARSGAMLTWEYFHPDEPAPFLVKAIQDRDLWEWKLESSREISAWIASHPKDFATWDWMNKFLEVGSGFDQAAAEGGAILRSQAAQIEGLAAKAAMEEIGGHTVPVVNSPLYQSEIGERLCQLHPNSPFSATFFIKTGSAEEIVVSLRSRNGFDVSQIAKKYGGGGHQAAAGFVYNLEKI